MHFHVALKLSKDGVFLPFKLALRQRSGFASHWSCSHHQLSSAVRYGVFTSEHMPVVDKEPLVWTKSGEKLDLYAESQETWIALPCRALPGTKCAYMQASAACLLGY